MTELYAALERSGIKTEEADRALAASKRREKS